MGGAPGQAGRLYWPAASALTARLRRLVTAYQRSNRRELQRQEALSRPDGRRRRRRDTFSPALTMLPPAEGGAAYLQEGGVFMAEGGAAYLAKSGPFVPEAAAHTALMGELFFKERRQRWAMSLYRSLSLSTALSLSLPLSLSSQVVLFRAVRWCYSGL